MQYRCSRVVVQYSGMYSWQYVYRTQQRETFFPKMKEKIPCDNFFVIVENPKSMAEIRVILPVVIYLFQVEARALNVTSETIIFLEMIG